MKCYWDTSALINALMSQAVMSRLKNQGGLTRSHTLAEFFGVQTGRGVRNAAARRPKPAWWPRRCAPSWNLRGLARPLRSAG